MFAFLAAVPLRTYLYAAVAVVFIGLSTAVKIQTSRLATSKAETVKVQASYDLFKEEVKQVGEAAQKAREKDIVDRYVITTKQEAENAKRYATLDSRYKSAIANARMPVTPTNPSSGEAQPLSSAAPLITCTDRQPDVAERLVELESGILEILKRGDRAIERTITCKNWLEEQLAK